MTRQEFDKLIEKYNSGACSPEEEQFLEKWAKLHFIRQMEQPIFDQEEEGSETEERIWRNVKTVIKDKPASAKRIEWGSVGKGWAAAIAALLLAGAVGLYQSTRTAAPESTLVGMETKNTSESCQTVILPDSSVVTLEPGAVLVADRAYGKKNRIVRLTGEASFHVQSNPEVPFLVYSGELMTEVLGTSFTIKPVEKKKTIEVAVMTGKVSIYTGKPGSGKRSSGIIATPNQKVVFDTESKTIRQDLVDTPEMIIPLPAQTSLRFDDAPIEEVLALLQKTYGIEIVISNAALKRCVFTGDLSGMGLYEQLDYFCDVLRVNYEIRGTGIFITGTGCG